MFFGESWEGTFHFWSEGSDVPVSSKDSYGWHWDAFVDLSAGLSHPQIYRTPLFSSHWYATRASCFSKMNLVLVVILLLILVLNTGLPSPKITRRIPWPTMLSNSDLSNAESNIKYCIKGAQCIILISIFSCRGSAIDHLEKHWKISSIRIHHEVITQVFCQEN